MKTAIILLTALFVASASAQSQDDALKEASQLSQQVVRLYNAGKYVEALPAAKRAVEIREKTLGKEDPLVADALSNLGAVMMALRKYPDAESAFQRALSIYEKAYGVASVKLCDTLNEFGWASYGAGNTSKSQEMFKRSLRIRENALGPDHADVALSLNTLARFYYKNGDNGKALDHYKRAIAVKEKSLGPNHASLVDPLEECACILRINNKDMEASPLEARAATIRNATGNGVKWIYAGIDPGPVIQGEAIHRETPQYPPYARGRRMTGKVIVEITIDETGKVENARLRCGADAFAQVSVEAARKWRFKPTSISGVPVRVVGWITFNFTQ
jgi:TonB family protein